MKVLVVYHREDVVGPIRDKFEKSGFSVRCASDGLDALFIARSERFALIIAGPDIPKVTGLELVRTLRNELSNAETPVILISSGKESEEFIRLSTRLNAMLMTPEELVNSVGNVMEKINKSS